jgi:hypothetical protein
MKKAMTTRSNLTRGHMGTSGYNGLFAYAAATVPHRRIQFLAVEPSAQLTCRPNPSLKLTRYGMRCKPGSRSSVHFREPGLHRIPPRSA